VPNVRDLAGEVTTLRYALDMCVIALARAHGISETTVRHNMGLPPGNPWRARRTEQAADGTESVVGAAIYTFRHPAPTADVTGPQIEDYAI